MKKRPHLIKPPNYHYYNRPYEIGFEKQMTVIEQVNWIILRLDKYGEMNEEMLLKWNEVYRWVMNEGLDETIGDRLNEWLVSGKFEQIINEKLLAEINDNYREVLNTVEQFISKIEDEYVRSLNEFEEIYYNIGNTHIEWSE